jgi:hypothetical protein
VEQLTPVLKFAWANRLIGNWFRWSPQKLMVVALLALMNATAVNVTVVP